MCKFDILVDHILEHFLDLSSIEILPLNFFRYFLFTAVMAPLQLFGEQGETCTAFIPLLFYQIIIILPSLLC